MSSRLNNQKNTRPKISISRYFILYAAIFTIFTSAIYFYLSQRVYVAKHDAILKSTTVHIEELLLDGIGYNGYIMEYLGNNIRNNPKDLKHISDLLSSFKYSKTSGMTTVRDTLFWADTKSNILVSSNKGIIEPFNISDRSYIKKAVAQPEKIHLGKVIYGRISHEWAIPTVLGIKDDKDNYVGALIFGFKLKNFKNKISRSLTNKNISYAVFNYSGKAIISSDKFIVDEGTLNNVNKAINNSQNTGKFDDFSIFSDNEHDGFYRKNDENSYIIITKYNNGYFHNRFSDILRSRLFELIIVLAILGLIFYFLVRIVFHPLNNLSKASRLIMQNRDNEADIPQNINISEIYDLAQQLRSLRQYKFDLVQARKSQERFFANMSHELRTPLNGILNFSSMMKDEMFGEMPDDYKDMANDIYNSGTYLLKLLNDILNFSNMDIGKIKINKEKINLVNEIKEVVKLTIPKSSANITYEIKDEIKLEADRKMLKQMLLEVLSNSAKFTNSGHITIKAFYDKEKLIIEVQDSGIGIKEEELKELNKDFGQMGDGYSRIQSQGNGLGIFLVKKMMELHQGQFEIDSEFGKGTTVRLIFISKNHNQT